MGTGLGGVIGIDDGRIRLPRSRGRRVNAPLPHLAGRLILRHSGASFHWDVLRLSN